MNRMAGAGLAAVSAVALVCLSVAWRRRTRPGTDSAAAPGTPDSSAAWAAQPAAGAGRGTAADDDWLARTADSEEAWW